MPALRQARSGTHAVDVCRKLGITQTTFYRWRRKHELAEGGAPSQGAPSACATASAGCDNDVGAASRRGVCASPARGAGSMGRVAAEVDDDIPSRDGRRANDEADMGTVVVGRDDGMPNEKAPVHRGDGRGPAARSRALTWASLPCTRAPDR